MFDDVLYAGIDHASSLCLEKHVSILSAILCCLLYFSLLFHCNLIDYRQNVFDDLIVRDAVIGYSSADLLSMLCRVLRWPCAVLVLLWHDRCPFWRATTSDDDGSVSHYALKWSLDNAVAVLLWLDAASNALR